MARTLYLVTATRSLEGDPLFPSSEAEDPDREVVLIQEAVRLTTMPVSRVTVLEDDLLERKRETTFPIITYRDMLEKVFAAERVIRL